MDNLRVYMNTWGNYNEYGADLSKYGIKDGWMTIDEALAFCDKYADDEPFINDIDNDTGIKIEVSEYSNPWQVLKGLKALGQVAEETGNDETFIADLWEAYQEREVIDSIDEETINDFKDFVENGDYHYWPDVSSDSDLGYAIMQEFGAEGISDPTMYVDWDEVKEALQRDVDAEYEEDDPDWYEVDDYEVEEFIKNSPFEGGLDNFFDYERLGRDVAIEEYVVYTTNGNCVEMYG